MRSIAKPITNQMPKCKAQLNQWGLREEVITRYTERYDAGLSLIEVVLWFIVCTNCDKVAANYK